MAKGDLEGIFKALKEYIQNNSPKLMKIQKDVLDFTANFKEMINQAYTKLSGEAEKLNGRI